MNCYLETGDNIILDEQFCWDNYENVDNIYDCFDEIGLNKPKDKDYCELKNPYD